MKKILLLLMLTVSITGYINAQTNIKIMDIVVTPVLNIDTVTGEPINPGTELNIMLKIKNVSKASKAYILFGTVQDAGDILSVQADFIENAGTYFLLYAGNQEIVNGYTARTVAELTSQQETGYGFITLYVEDSSGQETNRLYFKK